MNMKQLSLSAVLISVFVFNAIAGFVPKEKAQEIATKFYFERSNQEGTKLALSSIDAKLISSRQANNKDAFYVFDINNRSGFVIVSAEDAYEPIIGYSNTNEFPEGDLAEYSNLNSFLNTFCDQIYYIRKNNVKAESYIAEQWNYYSNIEENKNEFPKIDQIGPLLQSKWNQNYPYNIYCPKDKKGPGGHVYAGCVATAMATVMHYYRYPKTGTGSSQYYSGNYGTLSANYGNTNYNWNAMLNSINHLSNEAINAIAELQYHCGVSVKMGYHYEGSGAYTSSVPPAIKQYFGYSLSATEKSKTTMSNDQWISLLVEQLNAKKALYYAGRHPSDGGHAFNCDGYKISGATKHFHFNFGWSGSGNGFYAVTDVGGFNNDQRCIVEFVPKADAYPYGHGNHVITTTIGGFEDGSGPIEDYKPNGQSSWLIEPIDSIKNIKLKFEQFDLGQGDFVKIYDGADANAPILATYTKGANNTSAELTSTGTKMFVTFTTDATENGAGFDISFKTTKATLCSSSTNLTDTEGIITDGSGDKRYLNNTICNWDIDISATGKPLNLKFDFIDTETGYDIIKIIDKGTGTVIMDSISGDTPPEQSIIVPSGKVRIAFKTNLINNYQGFQISYKPEIKVNNLEFNDMLIWPNPANDYCNVSLFNKYAQNVTIELLTVTGQSIDKRALTNVSGNIKETFFFNKLNKGVYLIKIYRGNNSTLQKIVVN